MPSVRQIRRRIRSVENTAKITKAMSMIAASKMRRAQDMALRGRPYAEHMRALLSDLAAQIRDEDNLHPLLQRREIKKAQVILITPDRGLTGGLNTNVNRRAGQFVVEQKKTSVSVNIVAAGKKGRDFMARTGQDLRGIFINMGDRPVLTDITPISRIVIDDYTKGDVDAVYLAYPRFVTTTVQKPVVEPLLPVVPAELDPKNAVGYIYEPNSAQVLDALLPRFVEMQVYHAILEALASEQSARMVAMRSATDNANTMVDDLTLVMNKVRQDTITKELLDIVGGAAAVEG
ncbi:MAG: ATP synthase F1 subunit gamma [SAR202 cluster bacterium]|nr:ATP synthase F1 subunit gamma [SAR202 cluster bacterium]